MPELDLGPAPRNIVHVLRDSGLVSSGSEAQRNIAQRGVRVDGVRVEDRSLELTAGRSEEHTSELQSRGHLVCRLLLEKKKTWTVRRPTAEKRNIVLKKTLCSFLKQDRHAGGR